MSRLAKQAVILTTARIASYGLMFISPILLVRILSIADFGHYREFLVYTSLLQSFAAFAINDSLLYFIPAHPQNRWTVVRQTTILVACCSATIVAVVVGLDLLLKGALVGRFLWPLAAYVLLFVNIDFWEWYWLADHRSIPVFLYTAGRLIARMIVVVVAATTTHSVASIIWALIALEAVRLCGSAIAWKASSVPERESLANIWREQLKFCMPWGFATMIGIASRNLGNIAVVKLLGATSLAYYTIGLYGEPIVAAFRNSVSTVMLPEMVRRTAGESDNHLRIWRQATTVNCVVLLPIVVLLVRFAEPLVVAVFGNLYRASAPVLQIYALVIVRECFDLTLPLRSANKTKPLIRSSLVGLAANAACAVVLIPMAGIRGAVISLVIAGFAEAVYQGWCVCELVNTNVKDLLPWRSIIKISAAALAAGVITLVDWVDALGFAGVAMASALYGFVFLLLLRYFKLSEMQVLLGWVQRALQTVKRSSAT